MKHDPLLAPVRLSLFERSDALSLIAESFGFSDQSKDKGPYSFMLEANRPVIVDELEVVTLDIEGAETITADEVAFQLIRDWKLDEFVPRYFVHLCKSMRRERFPYLPYRDMEGWGGQRFLTLLERMRLLDWMSYVAPLQHIDKHPSKEEGIANRRNIPTHLEKMIPDKKALTVIHELLESDYVYERQNAAIVLGFYMLEEFYNLGSGSFEDLDRFQLDSGETPEIVDSRPAYEATWDRLTLIRSFVDAIPSVMPVGQLEGVLRVLLLYEAGVVTEPSKFALQPGENTEDTDSARLYVSRIAVRDPSRTESGTARFAC